MGERWWALVPACVGAARKEAERIGPATTKLVEALVEGDYPLKHLRRIQGILRLHSSRHVSTEALEYACEQAAKFARPRLNYVKACAEHFNAIVDRLTHPSQKLVLTGGSYRERIGKPARPT